VRIRYWSSNFDLNDIEDVAPRLAPALASRGHDVQLIAPHTDQPGDAIVADHLSILRLAPSQTVDLANLPAPVLEAPDVELVETGSPLAAIALAAIQQSARPVVASIHQPLADRTLESESPEGALLRAAAAIAVDTETLAGQLRAFIDGCRDRATIIRAGLPLTELAPGPRLLKRPRLLCVGPLTRDSGFDLAIDALAELRERIRTAELTVVGVGPEQAALEAQAGDLDLSSAVTFRGALDASRLPALVNQSSLILVPTRVPVSASAIAILAGQLLRPVIASAIGGIPEIVEQEGSGLLVVPEEPAAIAGAARRLLSEPGAAADLGRRGRTLARERFGWERFVTEVETLLSSTLERAGTSRSQGSAG